MPELPEVETTRRGVEPLLRGKCVRSVTVHEARLRRPIPRGLARTLVGAELLAVERRAKYLLFRYPPGTAIVHLGMSGSLRVVDPSTPRLPHDHVEIDYGDGACLRFRDPRRFGLLLFTRADPLRHELLCNLGPEPLSSDFDGELLYRLSRGRRGAVKNFIMDAHIVVGVGNIYASESLFRAGIHPQRPAGRIAARRYAELATHIKAVLTEAIAAGGTTLRDFVRNDGSPGYFRHNLAVYGREGDACPRCGADIRCRVIGQRSSFFCVRCQS